jgi:hypothetical protein
MKCINCGKDSAAETCLVCELELRAREKPQFLLDMEWVAANQPPQTEFQRAMQALLHKKPQDFLARLHSAQKDYDAKMRALAEVEASKAPRQEEQAPEHDEGSERVEELIERLLKEAAL